ncbi:MAG: hypothetical protein ACOXZZ_03375 [Sphaerochaetaceae bacterium]
MKRPAKIHLFLFVVFLLLSFNLFADAGPKPSVVIYIEGLEDRSYYMTLLSDSPNNGPYFYVDPNEIDNWEGFDDILKKFLEYPAAKDYYFIGYYLKDNPEDIFVWSYYPPNHYKVLLYFPDSDTFLVSEDSYSNYAFSTRYIMSVDGSRITLAKTYDSKKEIISLIGRVVLTLLVEIGVAYLFVIRKKSLLYLIVAVNIVTQVALNIALNFTSLYFGKIISVVFFLLLELLIFIIEAAIYALTFKALSNNKVGRLKAILYAFVANFSSLVVGFLLAYVYPGMF